MNFSITKPSPEARALILIAGLCLMLSCHKSKSQLGNNGAWVVESNTNNSNSNQTPEQVTANAPVDGAEPETSSARATRSRIASRQSFSKRVARSSELMVAMRKRAVKPSRQITLVEMNTLSYAQALSNVSQFSYSYEAEYSSSSDPAELIARASQLIRLASSASTVSTADGGPDPRATYYRLAATTAQKGVELLKQQPQPTEPAEKEKYTSTLLTGLSVRAEALGLLAYVDRAEGSAAETAYREYLAAESNESKRVSAEREFASILYKLRELDKAKSAYENLLARDADDIDALSALVRIHTEMARAEKEAGKDVESAANSQLATSYSDRLGELTSKRNARPTASTAPDEDKTRSAKRTENVNSDSARPKIETREKKTDTPEQKVRRRP